MSYDRSTAYRSPWDEEATLIRTTGYRDEWGMWNQTEASSPIMVTTAPVTSTDPRARILTEGGIRLDAGRLFWTTEDLNPVGQESGGDLIEWGGARWLVSETQRWGGFSESLAVRQD